MTSAKFAAYVRAKTGTNASTLTDATILLYANIVKDDIVKDVAKINEDIFGMYAYRDLVENLREYSFPENTLDHLKYLEVDLKGTGEYVRADEFDLNTYERSTDERTIRNLFSYKRPGFDIFRNSIFVYSGGEIIDVADGLRCYYIRYPDDLTSLSGTTELSNDLLYPIGNGIPRQFHMVWATKVIVMYKNSKDKPIALTESERNVEADYQSALRAMSGLNLDRDIQATYPLQNNGADY